MEDLAAQQEQLRQKTFLLMFRILLVFGIPAAIAYFVGKWIDTTYDVRPYGTLAMLGVAFITSWTVTIRIYFQVDREFRELREKQEAAEKGQSQTKE